MLQPRPWEGLRGGVRGRKFLAKSLLFDPEHPLLLACNHELCHEHGAVGEMFLGLFPAGLDTLVQIGDLLTQLGQHQHGIAELFSFFPGGLAVALANSSMSLSRSTSNFGSGS